MPERKKLIEVALPLEAINIASAREKSIRHGHPSTLHLWWARRPLATCRAVLFASVVDDPGNYIEDEVQAKAERKRIFTIIEKLVKWENSNDSAVLNTARLEIARSIARANADKIEEGMSAENVLKYLAKNAPAVLDPFCGGGSIPLEAQRLGLRVYASDLNPVAVLITKALIEIPPKFAGRPPVNPESRRQKSIQKGGWTGARGLAEDVRHYGQWIREEAEKRIGHLYPKARLSDGTEATTVAWLWARTVKCPNPACGATVPLVRSFWLSKKEAGRAWIEPVIERTKKTVTFTVKCEDGEAQPGNMVRKKGALCPFCSTMLPLSYLRKEWIEGRLGHRHLATVADGQHGRVFVAPDKLVEKIVTESVPAWKPEYELPDNPRYISPPLYGMRTYADLFTPRQLVALTTFSDLVGEVRLKVFQDALASGLPDDGKGIGDGGTGAKAYTESVATYLAFAVDKMTDTNTTLCTWQIDPPRLRATFGRQALPMTWDFAEANVFGDAAGDYQRCIGSLCEVLDNLVPSASGQVKQLDAMSTVDGGSHQLVSTDPPYYDNIGYADLADFFYVWLRHSLADIHTDIFSTVLSPKAQELVASPYRFDGDKERARAFFETGLGKAFEQLRVVQSTGYPLTVYYAFKQLETSVESDSEGNEPSFAVSTGWETMLKGLIKAGFSITGTWPMRSELKTRNVGRDANALASSIVLVCRPRRDNAPMAIRREFMAALKSELPAALKTLQEENIAPVDLAQASIGPGIAVFSRYSKVIEPDGSAMSVRTALQMINQELDSFLRHEEGEMDAETQFCVQWFEQYGMNQGAFGEADVLARAKATSVDRIARSGAINSRGGKVAIKPRLEYPPDWDPVTDSRVSLWECAQNLIKRYQEGGEALAAELVTKLGVGRSEDAKNLAYRLYSVCERKGWAEDAMPYNELVTAWPEIQRKAAGITGAGPQKILDVGVERRGKK